MMMLLSLALVLSASATQSSSDARHESFVEHSACGVATYIDFSNAVRPGS
jgi:hypothetical protein